MGSSRTSDRVVPTTLDKLRKGREVLGTSPAGNVYRLRPLNLERHALAGGLPSNLRELALQGVDGIQKVFESDDGLEEHGADVREYLDRLVAEVVVEPSLKKAADGSPDPELLELLPPVDYRWIVRIAMGEEDRDGEGRLLWGREPLSRWDTFRDEHGCPPDCDGCRRVLGHFSPAFG